MTTPNIEWIYYDPENGVYILNDPSSYLLANPGRKVVEIQVHRQSALASGVGLDPSDIPLTIKQGGEVYELSINEDFSVAVTRSGSTLVEGFLPISGGQLTGPLEVKSHTAYSGSGFFTETNAVTTSGFETVNLFTIPIEEGSSNGITVTVTSTRKASEGHAVAINQSTVLYYRQVGGSPARAGSVSAFTRVDGTSAGSYNMSLDVVGNNLEINLTGVADHTIYWSGNIQWQKVVTNV